MSRMRMMPENGTLSRYEAIPLQGSRKVFDRWVIRRCKRIRSSFVLLTVREVVRDVSRDHADRVFQDLAGSEMVAGEDADDDRVVRRFEDADVVADVGQEVAGLVRNAIAGDVSRDARAIELPAHDLQHQVR